MSAGSVSIAADGTVTSSGLAGDIYTARVAMLASVVPPGVIPSGPAGYTIKHGLALDANALAGAIYPEITAGLAALIPPGTLAAYAAASAPTGWLLCDGSAVSRTTYATLFAVTSTTYGVGDGSTTFNLPDLRGRAAIGSGTGDAADATAHALGAKSGTETHTLTVAETPAHTHEPSTGDGFVATFAGSGTVAATGAGTDWIPVGGTDTVGGGDPHNNMPPTLAVSWIIKT